MTTHILLQAGPLALPTATGAAVTVDRIDIDEASHLPDLRVHLQAPHPEAHLHDDAVFLKAANDQLRLLGYAGPDLDRAESGLQTPTLIVLEPTQEFRRFAAGAGWQNLALSPAQRAPRNPTRRFEPPVGAALLASPWAEGPVNWRQEDVGRMELSFRFRMAAIDDVRLSSQDVFGKDGHLDTLCAQALEEHLKRQPGFFRPTGDDFETAEFEVLESEVELPAGEDDAQAEQFTHFLLQATLRSEGPVSAETARQAGRWVQDWVDQRAPARKLTGTLLRIDYFRTIRRQESGQFYVAPIDGR